MAGEPYNEVVMKAAEKIISGGGGSVASPTVVQGVAAHDAAYAGNPVGVGGYASSNVPTAVTAADAVRAWYGLNGQTIIGVNNGTAVDGTANSIGFIPDSSGVSRPLSIANMISNGTTWDRAKKPNAASRIPSSANSVNATVAKASAGDAFGAYGYNSSATVTYLKIYNKATAPTVGTDVPVLTLPLPALATFSFDLSSQYFSAGISYGLTTDAADAGTTAVAAGAILGLNVVYA